MTNERKVRKWPTGYEQVEIITSQLEKLRLFLEPFVQLVARLVSGQAVSLEIDVQFVELEGQLGQIVLVECLVSFVMN